ncbi:MAG: EAL domain-containing protein [Spirochaetales bacterium]|uniref:EAL domain-containing protein n=1 Tax=Candidatus Thalassospirochaeta sargassi TaxID=3119039 RepID=A0AAJ1IHJ9_9SPIO|nr:EAL domain-containing protein [Spirochaetales bacterium]
MRKYENSDLIIKRKITAFAIALTTLIFGLSVYLLFQIITGTPYLSDLNFIWLTMLLLVGSFFLFSNGHFYLSANLVLFLMLGVTTLIVFRAETLNELKIYNLAFLQSIAIIFSILVAEKRRQIILVGCGSLTAITFFLIFRLLPVAVSAEPYISTFVTTAIFILMESWIGVQVYNLLNSTLEEIRLNLEHDEFTNLPNDKMMNRMIMHQKVWGDNFTLVFYHLVNLTELVLIFGVSNAHKVLGEVAEIIRTNYESDVFAVSNDVVCVVSSHGRTRTGEIDKSVHKILMDPIECLSFKVRVKYNSAIVESSRWTFALEKELNKGLLAIYHAGQKGLRTVDFQNSGEDDMREHLKMLLDLSAAIAKGNFKVVYQPLYNSEKEIIGYEALTRWMRPGGTKVSPAVFIPLLEKAGMMNDFFAMMFSIVVADITSYSFITPERPVFINLSQELINNNFNFYRVIKMIDEAGIPRSAIGFEITETSMASDTEKVHKLIMFLREGGFKIALDDFGMGYSNISQILKESFYKIKFDRSLIENISFDEKKLKLLDSLLNFFNIFGYKTLIEGVETVEEWELLKSFQFSEFQGYHLSIPLTPEELILEGLYNSS